jgi:hypothetical protein
MGAYRLLRRLGDVPPGDGDAFGNFLESRLRHLGRACRLWRLNLADKPIQQAAILEHTDTELSDNHGLKKASFRMQNVFLE